jgi:arginyl-tRNA synthetase
MEKLKEDPIRHLYEVYVQINTEASEDETIHDQARAYFKKMEDGDKEAMQIWQTFRDLSIVAYKQIYSRINVEFDVYSGESQYSMNQMRDSVNELQDKGLLKPDGGALIVDLKDYSLGTAVIGKTDGSMLYLSRDIAAASDRHEFYDFDKMFYCVGAAQDHHFRQLFKILELTGKQWVSKCQHIGFGLIKSKDGNMSTRKGTVVFLSDILDHVKEEMHTVMQKNEEKYKQIADPDRVSDVVGISAIMIQDMAARRIKDYAFDWARMLSFEGDTGPYLQYAHARLCSIERLATFKVTPESIDNVDVSLLTEPKAFNVLALVNEFPDVIRELSESLEPCQLVNYSLRLSHAVSSAYTDLWVNGQTKEIAEARLCMYAAARICLGNSLRLLGLEPLERM